MRDSVSITEECQKEANIASESDLGPTGTVQNETASKDVFGCHQKNCNQGINNPSFQDMDKQNLVLKKETGLFQQPTKIIQQGKEVYENKCFGSIDNPPKGKTLKSGPGNLSLKKWLRDRFHSPDLEI